MAKAALKAVPQSQPVKAPFVYQGDSKRFHRYQGEGEIVGTIYVPIGAFGSDTDVPLRISVTAEAHADDHRSAPVHPVKG